MMICVGIDVAKDKHCLLYTSAAFVFAPPYRAQAAAGMSGTQSILGSASGWTVCLVICSVSGSRAIASAPCRTPIPLRMPMGGQMPGELLLDKFPFA